MPRSNLGEIVSYKRQKNCPQKFVSHGSLGDKNEGTKKSMTPKSSRWRNFLLDPPSSSFHASHGSLWSMTFMTNSWAGFASMSCCWLFKTMFWIMMLRMPVYPQPSKISLSGHFSGSSRYSRARATRHKPTHRPYQPMTVPVDLVPTATWYCRASITGRSYCREKHVVNFIYW